jgi:hypothetical protein
LFKIFLTVKALNAQARIRGELSRLCLSFALEDDFCREEFSSNRTAMFAREALNVIPLKNAPLYFQLLRESSWMAETFPKLYHHKIPRGQTLRARSAARADRSPFVAVLDAGLYLFFGLYVRIRAEMKRRGLRRVGRYAEFFEVSLSRRQWLFPHARYSKLAQLYDRVYSDQQGDFASTAAKTPSLSLQTVSRS